MRTPAIVAGATLEPSGAAPRLRPSRIIWSNQKTLCGRYMARIGICVHR